MPLNPSPPTPKTAATLSAPAPVSKNALLADKTGATGIGDRIESETNPMKPKINSLTGSRTGDS